MTPQVNRHTELVEDHAQAKPKAFHNPKTKAMKNKNSLRKQLLAYSGMAAAIISSNSEAQVVYSDVVPDNSLTNSDYALDLNNTALRIS